jgi:hypothetical protein
MSDLYEKRLESVDRATKRLRRAEFDHRQAIQRAKQAGISMRVIAVHASVSHEQVRRIINSEGSQT